VFKVLQENAQMTKYSAGEKRPAELAKNTESRIRKPRRYIALKKGRDWYDKAEGQIAITQNPTPMASGRD
jgi:hypothetical protein